MGNNDRDYQPYNQPQPFQTQPSQGGYPSAGYQHDSFYNTGLPQEPTTAGAASYEWNGNQPNPTNNLSPDVHPSRDIYASSNPGYSQELQQQQQQQYSQDYYSRTNNQSPPSSSGDIPFQGNTYGQPNYGSPMYGSPASGSAGYDMNIGGMNSNDAMHGMQGNPPSLSLTNQPYLSQS